MTVETTVAFDVATFKRTYEEWDIDALLALYTDDLELIQIDRDNPPSAPRTRHGREILRGMLEHCAGAGVVATVENTVADGQRAAATITCEFPAAAGSWQTRSSSSRTAASSASSTSCPATRRERESDAPDHYRILLPGRRPRRPRGTASARPREPASCVGIITSVEASSSRLAPSARRSPGSPGACRAWERHSSARSPANTAAIADRRATGETRNQEHR